MAHTFARRLTAILFPERCVCCGCILPPLVDICAVCAPDVPRIEVPVCRRCGAMIDDCDCRAGQRYWTGLVAPFYYYGPMRNTLLRMKDEEDSQRMRFFARETARAVEREFSGVRFDAVVFVPSSKTSRRARGFEPVRRLAVALSKELSLPVWNVLYKQRETPAQKTLSAAERLTNLTGAFALKKNVDVRERTLLLVDDTVTTGSTLSECAHTLRLAGATAVYAAAACRNPPRRYKEENETNENVEKNKSDRKQSTGRMGRKSAVR